MRILQRYILLDFLVIFFMSLAVFTFVMCLGVIFKAMDLIAKDIGVMIILKIFGFNIPYILMFTIPMSTLCAVLLMFGRLSMDGEIVAMRASGMSIGQIIAPVIVISIILSCACIYINSELAPKSHFARRQALRNVGIADPINLLEEGRFVSEFKNMKIYVGKKNGNTVENVIMYEFTKDGKAVAIRVRAEKAVITSGKETNTLFLQMTNVRQEVRKKKKKGDSDPLHISSEYEIFISKKLDKVLDFSNLFRKGAIKKRIKDMTILELVKAIRNVQETFPHIEKKDVAREQMGLVVEANQRLALSICCFAFTLLGIPLGMKSRRRESSVGIGISLLLVFFFYFFVILAKSLTGHPEYRPDLIVWIPVIISELLGFRLISKLNG